MNTVMFDLQAAVMAASASGGNSALTEIPEEGNAFSDVLAAQKELVAEGEVVNQAVENGEVEADMPEDEVKQEFSEVLNAIENLDEGVKKAMMKLLQTVLKAFRGAEDDKERATDLFAIFSDGSAGMIEDEEDMLLGCELLSQTGLMIEAELTEGKEADEIIAEIEDFIVKILGEDADEATAAEIMASMLNIPVEQLADTDEEVKYDAVKGVAEILTAPKETVSEINTEDIPKMEKLYADIKDMNVKMNSEISSMLRLSFTSVKINNASEQLAAIVSPFSKEAAPEATRVVETKNVSEEHIVQENIVEDVAPEVVTADVQQPIANEVNTVAEKPVITEPTAESIRTQVTEIITEKLMSFGENDGVEEMTMILKPENLGEVAVKLIKENGAITVLISAQYDEVGKTLADRASLLGNSLQSQNYNVKDIQIVEAGNAAEQMGLDFTNQGFGFSRESGREQGSNYRAVNGIGEIEETEAVEETAKLKEAKLWTTA